MILYKHALEKVTEKYRKTNTSKERLNEFTSAYLAAGQVTLIQ